MASKYCSEECRASAKRKLRKLKLKPKCEICEAEFERASSRQKVCSPECQAAKDERYRAEYVEQNRERLAQARREYMRAQAQADPEAKREKDRKWRAKHRESLNARRRTPEHRAKAAARARRQNENPHWRLHNRISAAIYNALKATKTRKNGRSWESVVGYSIHELKEHLERQFLPGMGWHNMGEWHVDHIRPRAMFQYESESDPEFKDCWALTNLRPLWATDNQQKHAKRVFLL